MRALAVFKFRLYVAGDGPHSAQAFSNLHALCAEHLPGQHEIEVIDVLREPERSLAEGVMFTPLLVKLAPVPVRRVIGTLSQRVLVLQALGLSG